MPTTRPATAPLLIIVDGAMTTRTSGTKPQLTDLLADHFTVLSYDRRGRGDSGDTQPYADEREIEDIEALIDQARPGRLPLRSLLRRLPGPGRRRSGSAPRSPSSPCTRPRTTTTPPSPQAWAQYLEQLAAALAENRRGDAVALFMRLVGTPADQVEAMRQAPFWPGMEAVAPTLAYDHAGVMGRDPSVPVERAAQVDIPALVMYGTASLPFMAQTARTLSQALPHAELRALDGQDHNVDPAVLAPVLTAFLDR